MVELVELRPDGSEGEQLMLMPSNSLQWQHLEPRFATCFTSDAERQDMSPDDDLTLKFVARSKPLLLQYKPSQLWPEMELPGLLRPTDHWPLPARPETF